MTDKLIPAAELSSKNKAHHPNESPAYREARNKLLTEEIELRRHIEKVARMRRALPQGGEIPFDYNFVGENGPVKFSDLFGDKDTLIIYSYMFGPKREAPCPMCTSQMKTYELKMQDIDQRAQLIFVARSPIERLLKTKELMGWKNLRLFSDLEGKYTHDYVSATDEDMPAMNVFTKRDGKIRHFWSEEMSFEMADPGQDPRGSVELDPLWHIIDLTPEGRPVDWYPSLSYGAKKDNDDH